MQRTNILIGICCSVLIVIGLGALAVYESYSKSHGSYVPGQTPENCVYLPLNNKQMAVNCIDTADPAFAATIDRSMTDVNIFATLGTLPTLFAAFQIFNHPEEKHYVWFSRTGTINIDKYPIGVEMMHPAEDYTLDIMNAMLNTAHSAILRFPNANFHVYSDDLRIHFGPLFTTLFGLKEDRWDMTLLSDGTATYTMGEYADSDSLAKWNKVKGEIHSYYSKVEKGDVSFINLNKTAPWGYGMHQFGLRDNVTYWCQYPDKIISGDDRVNQILRNDVHYKTFIPNDEILKMTETNRAALIDAVLSTYGLTEQMLNDTYFTEDNDKGFLIITNTNPIGAIGKGYTEAEYKNMMEQVVELYGDKYNLRLSSHPAALATDENGWKPYFESLGIMLLPTRLPMEVTMWLQPDARLGGFNSSLYMSALPDRTEFFFAKDVESLVAPLDLLFDLLFKDAVFIQPKI